ncbi:23S rRNA (pseudouridine(1915)-N(3))-methyltransferase RlmH [Mogibacterium sp.]|uniref:23S rRNA (pseudouridine(1915)-N(3))-methyltransferase RlmH n=1 Tax=Mogibacterium sp. TaxID=2049035 RepID=UPI00258263CD|nr:23S rRNA (pseudouridine(1915)-N(3))-methyltransferase RlmH [Mogibacterium sp.]MCI7124565.1 23S rRNA (pseudouridine(1915)-N(3))-methyltransferase RlmH [Mogibacterium sp.]
MNINIICIGKLKEKYWQAAVAEYTKRIGGYVRIQIVELKESKLPKNASPADESQVMEKEGETILSKIGESDYVIAMEVEGKMLDSVELSRHLTKTFDSGRSTVDFIIGGSLGLSPAVKKRADFGLSFSRMTFPHQMARVLLLEQIYRSFKIANNETYHK